MRLNSRLRARHKPRHHWLMDANRYRQVIAALGLSQNAAARLLGVNERTGRRYADGSLPIPADVGEWLELILRTKPRPPGEYEHD